MGIVIAELFVWIVLGLLVVWTPARYLGARITSDESDDYDRLRGM